MYRTWTKQNWQKHWFIQRRRFRNHGYHIRQMVRQSKKRFDRNLQAVQLECRSKGKPERVDFLDITFDLTDSKRANLTENQMTNSFTLTDFPTTRLLRTSPTSCLH